MATWKIGAPNWIEPSWVALSLGSWGSPSTLDNLKDSDFGNPAISVDATTTSTQFALDFSALATIRGANPGVDCLFIPSSNLTQAATIRVKLGTAAFTSTGTGGGSVAFDSTAIAALTQNIYPAGYTNTWGRNNDATPDKVIDASYNRGVLVVFGSTFRNLFGWVGINDTGNPDGKIVLSRLFLGPFWQPPRNFDYGVTISLDGTRVASESSSNSEFIDPNRKLRRVVTFQASNLAIDEAQSVFLPLSMYLGYAKQALFVFDPSDTFHTPRRTFMVVQKQPASIAYHNFGLNDIPITLQEVT